jgi:hypothetical protein
MKFTQKQIDEMDLVEVISNIEIAFDEQREKIDQLQEVAPILRGVLAANVEIVEEEEEDEDGAESMGVQANIVRADKDLT